jgi:hypothetical protein
VGSNRASMIGLGPRSIRAPLVHDRKHPILNANI